MQALGPNQELWLHDLETTPLPQARQALFTLQGFCCLGLGCLTFDLPLTLMDFEPEVDEDGELYQNEEALFAGENQSAPLELIEKLALYDGDGSHRDNRVNSPDADAERDADCPALTRLNDVKKLTFREIAAVVRTDPSLYFSEPR